MEDAEIVENPPVAGSEGEGLVVGLQRAGGVAAVQMRCANGAMDIGVAGIQTERLVEFVLGEGFFFGEHGCLGNGEMGDGEFGRELAAAFGGIASEANPLWIGIGAVPIEVDGGEAGISRGERRVKGDGLLELRQGAVDIALDIAAEEQRSAGLVVAVRRWGDDRGGVDGEPRANRVATGPGGGENQRDGDGGGEREARAWAPLGWMDGTVD